MFLATGTESAAIYSKCVVSLRKDYAQEGFRLINMNFSYCG